MSYFHLAGLLVMAGITVACSFMGAPMSNPNDNPPPAIVWGKQP